MAKLTTRVPFKVINYQRFCKTQYLFTSTKEVSWSVCPPVSRITQKVVNEFLSNFCRKPWNLKQLDRI